MIPPASQKHGVISLDLHMAGGVSADDVQRDALLLARAPGEQGEGSPLVALLGLSLDVASCIEGDGSVSSLFITPIQIRAATVDKLLGEIERGLPTLGPELIHGWAAGFTHLHLTDGTAVSHSVHAQRRAGEVSSHALMEMRAAAKRALLAHFDPPQDWGGT